MIQTSEYFVSKLPCPGEEHELTMFTILPGLLELTRPLVLLAQHQSSLDNNLTYR